jgi:hypothetical protein
LPLEHGLQRLDISAEGLGQAGCGLHGRIDQQHHKLFTTVAGQHVALAVDPGLHQRGQGTQAGVSARVPVLIVDLLEVIDVEDDQRQ